ncbi:MAG: protein arginine kinase [Gemmataceae bacterium]|nr:protein arginine kinase [Planctomycetota bacterium]
MNLDALAQSSGEWLNATGPQSQIVVSTRIRLARNLAAYPFTNRTNNFQKGEIEALVCDKIRHFSFDVDYHHLANMPALDRQVLFERHLISRDMASGEGPRGVAFNTGESISLMVNEEDHLRLQVMRSGLDLQNAWTVIDDMDNQLESRLSYAFSEEFGYLTACPTNVGTGMRASVMLHLPALEHTRHIEQVYRALQKISLEVRGLYGEGSRASGHFYQISNQVTLGKSEPTIIKELGGVIPEIIRYENEARQAWLADSQQPLKDRIQRVRDTIATETQMSCEEAIECLSILRLATALGEAPGLGLAQLDELFIQVQQAHLQKIMGGPLDSEERNTARAQLLRQKLDLAKS